jgi:hypothetical protein
MLGMNIPGGATNWRILKQAAPTPPYTLDAGIMLNMDGSQYRLAGVGFRSSSDAKLSFFVLVYDGLYRVYQGTASASFGRLTQPSAIYVRLTDDGTNRIYSFSHDGVVYPRFYSVARTNYHTADELFWGGDSNGASAAMSITLFSWKITT